jgi:hypothetical protein
MATRPIYLLIYLMPSLILELRTLAGYSTSQRTQLDNCTTQQKVNAACAFNLFF